MRELIRAPWEQEWAEKIGTVHVLVLYVLLFAFGMISGLVIAVVQLATSRF